MRLKHILRRLLAAPMFTGVVILTLAIGIGANTAIFSVIEGVLLRPLPYPQPATLVALDHVAPGITFTTGSIGSAPFLYFTYREQAHAFQDVGMWSPNSVTVTGTGEPERVDALDFTDGMLPVLGVQPALGRVFSREDGQFDSPQTVMLSYGYWQSKFGGDRSVIGKRLVMDGRAQEIVGVLPRDFWFFDRKPSLVQPLRFNRNKVTLGNFSYNAVARIKPGVTIAEAKADVTRLIPVAGKSFPPPPGFNGSLFEKAGLYVDLHSLKDEVIGDIGSVLWVLMGTIGMVLLIACANVANLLLVRAEGRQQELAIRAALGADWKAIAKELLVESMTLGVLGGAFGLGIAYGSLRLLVALAPANLPRLSQISIDAPVLLFTFLVSIFAGLLFGAIPTVKYAGPQLALALRAGGRTSSQSRERHRARNTLVIVQMALAVVLLVSSGLMIRTFYALKQVNPGFNNPAAAQTFRLSIPSQQVSDSLQVVHMQQDIVDRIAAIPGVQSVGMSSLIPMSNSGWHDPVWVRDKPDADSKAQVMRIFKFTSPGLRAAMGNTLVAGREFTWADSYEKRPVAIVSENMARELWGSPTAALGKQIRGSTEQPWREVVGVVGDERHDGVNQKSPTIVWWPQLMDSFGGQKDFIARSMSVVIRSPRAGSSAFMEEVRKAVWAINPSLPLAGVHTLDWYVERSMARTSFTLVMLAIAGGMALLLGVIGIYGVISYSVSQRRREIGIRMALGSPVSTLTAMFVKHGLRLASIGVIFGLAAAMAMTRLIAGFLFEVRPIDPLTYLAVSLGLAAAAVLASYVPALRAAGVNPVEALRAD